MSTKDPAAGRVCSADGTTIAFERSGAGPALIMVDAAGGYREFGPMRSLATHLAADFTVVTYDRRGRGLSADTLPYAVRREVEDLDVLITEAGGSAFLYAYSSGGLLALQAAASGLAIRKLALFEPPIQTADDEPSESDLTAELAELVAAGRLGDAVEHFQTAIGVPAEFLDGMRETPSWSALQAVAHTLVYDCMISDATSLELVASVTAPTLVLDSEGTTGPLTGWAAAIVDALPDGTHRSLAGEWHGVSDDNLVPVLAEFFRR